MKPLRFTVDNRNDDTALYAELITGLSQEARDRLAADSAAWLQKNLSLGEEEAFRLTAD